MNGDEQVNPFWSQGVQDAVRVDRLRPAALLPSRATPESLPPVPADEWDGDETPRPVQGLFRAMGSGGGRVRSQGQMPTKWHLKHQTAGILNLQDHRAPRCSGCRKKLQPSISLTSRRTWRGIPQVDLLDPLGGEGHRGKGHRGKRSWRTAR